MPAGTPRNMKIESEIMVPPPANVFINPTNTPEMISAKTTSHVIS
jgi:hypothetical protein